MHKHSQAPSSQDDQITHAYQAPRIKVLGSFKNHVLGSSGIETEGGFNDFTSGGGSGIPGPGI